MPAMADPDVTDADEDIFKIKFVLPSDRTPESVTRIDKADIPPSLVDTFGKLAKKVEQAGQQNYAMGWREAASSPSDFSSKDEDVEQDGMPCGAVIVAGFTCMCRNSCKRLSFRLP